MKLSTSILYKLQTIDLDGIIKKIVWFTFSFALQDITNKNIKSKQHNKISWTKLSSSMDEPEVIEILWMNFYEEHQDLVMKKLCDLKAKFPDSSVDMKLDLTLNTCHGFIIVLCLSFQV